MPAFDIIPLPATYAFRMDFCYNGSFIGKALLDLKPKETEWLTFMLSHLIGPEGRLGRKPCNPETPNSGKYCEIYWISTLLLIRHEGPQYILGCWRTQSANHSLWPSLKVRTTLKQKLKMEANMTVSSARLKMQTGRMPSPCSSQRQTKQPPLTSSHQWLMKKPLMPR